MMASKRKSLGLLAFLFILTDSLSIVSGNDSCENIERAFRNSTHAGSTPACQCLPESLRIAHRESDAEDENGVWIGCTRQSMPAVFRTLNALNETQISHLWIWNSILNILPNDMFANVRPRTLTIENSAVSVFRPDAFSKIGRRLRSLRLKNNILKSIERRTFADLGELQMLDLSGNKLSEIKRGQFDDLGELRELMLASNQIQNIEDGSFASLINVKTLNLANNKLTRITKETLRGLINLEVLNLNGNDIGLVEKDAFAHMKALRILDLGSNRIAELDITGLPKLQYLYVNNNTIRGFDSLTLRDLPQLLLLNADRNRITKIDDQSFKLIGKDSHLFSLSLAENNISAIGCNAFGGVRQLVVLALQNNKIDSLSCHVKGKSANPANSFLWPLKKLRSLFLSHNVIELLEDGDLNVLPNLKEVSLDHNKLTEIRKNALDGLTNLRKFFINNNNLYYLPEGIFDFWKTEDIRAVDFAENPWECICDREWISKWLAKIGAANTPSGSLRCLAAPCNADEEQVEITPDEEHSVWITIVAAILALVALLLLIIASVFIYMHERCYPISTISLKGMPSDMMRLIGASQESLLSFPNPIATSDLLKQTPPPALSTISINIKDTFTGRDSKGDAATEAEAVDRGSGEKKRVRFDGV